MEHAATLQFFLFVPLAFTNKLMELDVVTKERKWHISLQEEGSQKSSCTFLCYCSMIASVCRILFYMPIKLYLCTSGCPNYELNITEGKIE